MLRRLRARPGSRPEEYRRQAAIALLPMPSVRGTPPASAEQIPQCEGYGKPCWSRVGDLYGQKLSNGEVPPPTGDTRAREAGPRTL